MQVVYKDPRFCSRCDLVFITKKCPNNHPVFLYSTNIPERSEKTGQPYAVPKKNAPKVEEVVDVAAAQRQARTMLLLLLLLVLTLVLLLLLLLQLCLFALTLSDAPLGRRTSAGRRAAACSPSRTVPRATTNSRPRRWPSSRCGCDCWCCWCWRCYC